MPRTETIISVFVSSPSDVASERKLLEEIIAETNANWSRSSGVRFTLTRWESDSRPGFGADPQAVLNDQLPDDYDVFIGILWGRIGTPTPRAVSGTLEEFDRAYARYKQDPSSVEIMIYFKDAGISPSAIDPQQLAQVMEFKSGLGSKGGLYSTFTDEASFEDSLRAHFASLAANFSSAAANDSRVAQGEHSADTDKVAGSEPLQEEDLGLLDFVEVYETEMAALNRSVEAISGATETIGDQMSTRAAEINALPEVERTGKAGRRIVRVSADDLERYASTLQAQVPNLAKSRSAAFDALNSALIHHRELDNNDDESLNDLEAGLQTLHDAVAGSLEGMRAYRTTIFELPKLSGHLNRAKRSALEQLDQLTEELEATISTAANIIESISRIQKS